MIADSGSVKDWLEQSIQAGRAPVYRDARRESHTLLDLSTALLSVKDARHFPAQVCNDSQHVISVPSSSQPTPTQRSATPSDPLGDEGIADRAHVHGLSAVLASLDNSDNGLCVRMHSARSEGENPDGPAALPWLASCTVPTVAYLCSSLVLGDDVGLRAMGNAHTMSAPKSAPGRPGPCFLLTLEMSAMISGSESDILLRLRGCGGAACWTTRVGLTAPSTHPTDNAQPLRLCPRV